MEEYEDQNYPQKCSKMVMDNKRGLFLTNVLSKVLERVLDLVTSEDVWMSEYQCGGQKQRRTVDNIIMMRSVIDNNVRLNKKTYCYFADAYKCFDKLWLKDCLVEMWRAGMREKEVMLIYELNRKADIVIETPVGMTENITVTEIVKQGTVYGPKLCCVATEKVNSLNHLVSTYTRTRYWGASICGSHTRNRECEDGGKGNQKHKRDGSKKEVQI